MRNLAARTSINVRRELPRDPFLFSSIYNVNREIFAGA